MKLLEKRFDFKKIDKKWSDYWVDKQIFHAKVNPQKEAYTIIIPPPNVTGILHMGHALNNTLQDIVIRYKKMNGFETCWMPGIDHAGIATQNVVEKKLAKEGKTRHDVTREDFLDKLWAWKNQYGGTIIEQLKKMGSACDWPRTNFTMDDHYSLAVKKVFIDLYNKGLIYQGKYIINWCPRCHTALSDEEAEHHDMEGKLWHIKYPLKEDKHSFVTVATTRPETMLGDTAIAVNPNDERHKKLIGKKIILPILNREITIIADEFVDPKFGSGVVKVTPAHDPNDFAMGQRHNLEIINIMNHDATLNEEAGPFKGLDRFEARKQVLKALEDLNLLVKTDVHQHSVGHCYRCHTVVEPYLSKQWFVKMKPLAEPALKVVLDGKIKFYPSHWTKVYTNWLENIRDWCISRQIWWGHRIPVWYCKNDSEQCRQPIVTLQEPKECPHCHSKDINQDEDVLDTWFSSWLWPFATFHWPKESEDLKYFYPGNALFTASEIIFFWVARMIMAGLEFNGEIPFTDVFIHGTVRDDKGQKMSKSLGNAIDPVEIIEQYGADALRFSLIINSGQDLFISKDKFEIGRNFANKIWNASRLVLTNCVKINQDFDISNESNIKQYDTSTKWILSKLNTTLTKVSLAIKQYKYSEAENYIYEFFWNQYCDWYLEIIKSRWNEEIIQNVSYKILETSLKMMHPFVPFVTEEIWETMHKESEPLCLQNWPNKLLKEQNLEAEERMDLIIELIGAIRNIRSNWGIKPNEKINCFLSSPEKKSLEILNESSQIITTLTGINQITVANKDNNQKNTAKAVVKNIKCSIPLDALIDIKKEKLKINKIIDEQNKLIQNLSKRLKNKNFLDKAPNEVVVKEQDRLKLLITKNKQLKEILLNLK